ncbi:MAG: hypothetical protein LBJ11_08615 [Oscillospiraceae bacterium]|jgi:hypothetical protein|nr:hypothetical protein [Oscillospiraceae bacterium]
MKSLKVFKKATASLLALLCVLSALAVGGVVSSAVPDVSVITPFLDPSKITALQTLITNYNDLAKRNDSGEFAYSSGDYVSGEKTPEELAALQTAKAQWLLELKEAQDKITVQPGTIIQLGTISTVATSSRYLPIPVELTFKPGTYWNPDYDGTYGYEAKEGKENLPHKTYPAVSAGTTLVQHKYLAPTAQATYAEGDSLPFDAFFLGEFKEISGYYPAFRELRATTVANLPDCEKEFVVPGLNGNYGHAAGQKTALVSSTENASGVYPLRAGLAGTIRYFLNDSAGSPLRYANWAEKDVPGFDADDDFVPIDFEVPVSDLDGVVGTDYAKFAGWRLSKVENSGQSSAIYSYEFEAIWEYNKPIENFKRPDIQKSWGWFLEELVSWVMVLVGYIKPFLAPFNVWLKTETDVSFIDIVFNLLDLFGVKLDDNWISIINSAFVE